METQTQVKVKTGYEYLREMCSFQSDFNAFTPKINPVTDRVLYIRHQLKAMGVSMEMEDVFNSDNPENLTMSKTKFVNVYSFFKGESNNTIVFLAHHDVANMKSENCQDNTASVCNLLHLCELLKQLSELKKLKSNVLVAWTDAEEIVSPATCGAKRLSILCKLGFFGNVTKAINLELTANGTELWGSCLTSHKLLYDIQTKYKARKVQTPYNDAFVLERNGMSSVCIGILSESELNTAVQRGFCKTWALCHTDIDTIENASETDMSNFVENVLVKMAEE